MASPSSISRKSAGSSHPPSLISMEDLENQRTRLKPPVLCGRSAAPMDVRDSLMAEIRNAGGIRALRKTSARGQ
ncbi:hypothetical protein ANCDUO_01530 [Ancylostoma duodenale]|uniref:WH2 domain-containing protein n=1 Tax=Ancylostoma duodenale TaxID=51022 RepID=A0A0C2DYN9_9BILA|nr:hypothetical protein ANCDUO_01530 [Ancylostoma duodenale]